MFSQQHIQRPGLLLANCGTNCGNNNYVYVAFSMMDGNLAPYPNGAMFGYNTSNLGGPFQYFKSSQGLTGSDGGGIWQDGAAPAFGKDDTGANFIYFNTGNGAYDGTSNWGDSFIKLDPANLTVPVASFTPADQWYRQSPTCTSALNPGDMDFGSGGVTLIPDSELVNWGDLAVSGDKEGGIWFLDRTAPDPLGFQGSSCNNSCTCSVTDSIVQVYWTGTPPTLGK